MKPAAVLLILLAACTSVTDPTTSTSMVTEELDPGFPCLSAQSNLEGDTRVFVDAAGEEVAAAMGWIERPPCADSTQGAIDDGFFEGLESTIVQLHVGDDLHVRAPGFDGAQLEVLWHADGSSEGVPASSSKVESGVWRVDEIPDKAGVYTLGIRFEYGTGNEAVFAATAQIGE